MGRGSMAKQKLIRVPITLDEFDSLAKLIVKKYKLENREHAAAVLTAAIKHLPPTQAYATLDYFAHFIIKNIANTVAQHKFELMRHEEQVDALINKLTNDPADTESRDKLELAASAGSEYAKTALSKIEMAPVALS